jgi:DMSO/TMAO reductase YedYZ molybdopterin-dependent catalytic subunit
MKDNKSSQKNILILFIIGILIMLSFSGCLDQTIELDGVEIEQYQGKDLSSINDFRENSIKGPQEISLDDYRLKITGLVEKEQEYTYDEIIEGFQPYKKVIRLNCVEGWSVDILWEGILVKDLLQSASPTEDAKIIIFHAEDGYTTSLDLNYIIDNNIILAYKMNNVTLPKERGFPFQLAAESKWGYKWIKWVTEIELSDDINYEGYWEKRGFSNTANINESFFD